MSWLEPSIILITEGVSWLWFWGLRLIKIWIIKNKCDPHCNRIQLFIFFYRTPDWFGLEGSLKLLSQVAPSSIQPGLGHFEGVHSTSPVQAPD